VGYLDLDYHSTSGIVLGGFCDDSSRCCTNCPDGIIERVGIASRTVQWSKYLTSSTNETTRIEAIRWEPGGTKIAAVAIQWNNDDSSESFIFIFLDLNGNLLQALSRFDESQRIFQGSFLYPDPTFIIAAGKYKGTYIVFKLPLASSSTVGTSVSTSFCRVKNLGSHYNYGITLDGGTGGNQGYFISG
jgi:hypothetical protein